MKEKKERKFICIRCPRGCEIYTTINGYSIDKIEGNLCALGLEYVKTEITDPRRVVTSTVRVKNGVHPVVPVWTTEAIPIGKIFDLMKKLREIEFEAPIEINTCVLKNVFEMNIDVITSGKVEKG